jgi:hypothetical protein
MRFNSLLVAVACALALQNATAADEGAYKFLSEIPIGGEGGWDILTIDSPMHRLYLSHATKVVVVDLAKNAVAGEITDTPGVHGFVVAPELQRGFSSNGKEAKVSVVDLESGHRRRSGRAGLRTSSRRGLCIQSQGEFSDCDQRKVSHRC